MNVNTGSAYRRRKARSLLPVVGFGLLLPLLLWTADGGADQYQSEVRELPGTPPPTAPQDAATLLESTTDPYARALLLRDLAGRAVESKDYAAAAKYLQDAIGQGALSDIAQTQMRKDLTQLLVATGEPEAIIQALEKSVRNNPRAAPEQQAALGGAYLSLKRPAEALPLLQRAVAAKSKPEESWLQALVAAQLATGKEKDAMPVLEKLLRVNPARREYWIQLAGLQIKFGNKAQAAALLELAARQGYLESADDHLQLVSLTAELGAPFEAGSMMQSWMDAGKIPAIAGNWEVLAGLWVTARESGLAAQALDRAVALEPQSGRYLQLGQLRLQREEYAQAAAALESGLQGGARSGPALLALGSAYFHQAEIDAALRAFERASRIPETQSAAQQWLEYLGTPSAREQAQRLAARSPPTESEVTLSGRLSGAPARIQLSLLAPAPPSLRRVGGRLTPVGAERDASADGTIPEWDGGLLKARWPRNFKPGERLADPYPEDQPLFVITGENAARYASKLSDSHRALLATYPSYRMPVFPTRRSVAYPQEIYDASQANIGKAKLIGSDALTGARLGFPFPEPENGVEVMWNHRVRYRGDSVRGISSGAVVGDGAPEEVHKSIYQVLFRYGNVSDPVDIEKDNILLYGITWLGDDIKANPEFVVLFHEPADSIKKSRGIWALLGKVGRMFRIPPLGYDRALYGSGGIAFIDMIDMYNGAFDRYLWKLVGKREMFIPYNSFRLNDGRYSNADLLTPKHFNPDGTRYELHRVWVIEATERGGKHHAFGKRVFYVDEDTWNVVLVENYDRKGAPWRFQEGHLLPFYANQNANAFPIITYDLKDGRYYAQRLLGEDPPVEFDVDLKERDFLPASVKRTYSR